MSAVTDVSLLCHLLHVILLPVVVSCIVYEWSWWLWSPLPTIVPWVHSPPSSCWTTKVDPIGRDAKIGEASLLILCCLSINQLWCLPSLSLSIGFLSKGLDTHNANSWWYWHPTFVAILCWICSHVISMVPFTHAAFFAVNLQQFFYCMIFLL